MKNPVKSIFINLFNIIFMNKIIGRKSKENLNPGYVWAPYIIKESTPILVDGDFSPFSPILNRYGGISIPQKRCRKIKSILENEQK